MSTTDNGHSKTVWWKNLLFIAAILAIVILAGWMMSMNPLEALLYGALAIVLGPILLIPFWFGHQMFFTGIIYKKTDGGWPIRRWW